jgi:hypothetical protein
VSVIRALAAQVVAATAPSPSPSPTLQVDPDRVTPGALGFFSVVFLGVAIFFLWKSLNKQVKRVDFDEEHTYTRAKDRAKYEASQESIDAELAELADGTGVSEPGTGDTAPSGPDEARS